MDQSQAQDATTETEPGDTQTQHLLQNHTNKPGWPTGLVVYRHIMERRV